MKSEKKTRVRAAIVGMRIRVATPKMRGEYLMRVSRVDWREEVNREMVALFMVMSPSISE